MLFKGCAQLCAVVPDFSMTARSGYPMAMLAPIPPLRVDPEIQVIGENK